MKSLQLFKLQIILFCSSLIIAGCSSGLNKTPSSATRSTITGTGPVVSDGVATSVITITLLDGDSAPLQGVVPTFDATDTDSGNTYGACSASNANGISTCSLSSIKKELKQLHITSPVSIYGASVLFIPGPIDHITVITQPSTTAVAGVAFSQSPIFEARDETDNIVTSTSPNITLSAYSDSLCTVAKTGTLSATANPVTPSAGVITFSSVSFTKTGTLYLKASTLGATSACTNAITITHHTAHHISLSTAPSTTATAGVVLTTQPVVEVLDQYNNRVTTGAAASSSVTLAAFSNAACTSASTTTLSATQNPVNATTGLATFAGITTTLAQPTYLKFSVTGLTALCSAAITVSPNSASTATSTITGTGPIAANGFHTSTITIFLKDVYSNPIPSITPTFSATNTGATNVYGACSATNGAGATNCTLKSTQHELKTLAITSPISKSDGTVNFLKPPDATLSIFTASTPVTADGVSTSSVSIQFLDSTGTAVVGLTPVLASTGTGNTISACTATDLTGNSSCTVKSTKAENKTFSLTSPLVLSGPGVTFVHGAATKLSFALQPSSSAVAGVNLAVAPQVEVLDATNNRVISGGFETSSITLAAYSNNTCTVAGLGTFSVGTNPVNASAGIAAFSNINYTLAGVFYIKASAVGLTSACSSAITISPAAYSLAQSTFTVSAATVNSALSITATLLAKDTYGNSTPSGLPVVGSIQFFSSLVGGTGTYGAITNPTAGTYQATFTGQIVGAVTLSAKISGVSVTQTQNVTVNPGAAASLVFTVQPSSSNTAGSVFATVPEVTVLDSNSNVLTNLNSGSVGLTVSAGTISAGATANISAGVATFSSLAINLAGTNRILTATYSSITQTSNAIDILPDAANELKFATQPSSSGQMNRDWLIPPAVEITDAFHNRITTGGDSTLAITLSAFLDSHCTTPSLSSLSIAQNPVTATSGLSTFTNINHPAAETIYIKADAPGMAPACSTAISILHWRAISTTGAPAARAQHGSVWAGNKLMIWGGKDGAGTALNTGGLYTPTSDTWTSTSTTGSTPSPRFDHIQLWTGTEVIIWGGQDGSSIFADGALFNPGTNSWTVINSNNAPTPRTGFTATWTGTKLLIFGGKNGSTYYDDLFQYDPSLDQWSLLSNGLLSAREELISAFDSVSGFWYLLGGKDGGGNLFNGVIYNSATSATTVIPAEPSLGAISKSTSAATVKDVRLWVYGTSAASTFHSIDLQWNSLSATNEPVRARSNFATTTTSDGLFIFGGDNGTTSRSTGATWNSVSETWQTLPSESASPALRTFGSASWSGTEVFIWGGCSDGPTCSAVSNLGWSLVP